MMNKINWEKIWSDFDDWVYNVEDTKECKSCGSHEYFSPNWEDWKVKIRELVDNQIFV